ncbi:MAG: PAS domain-containing protein [Nannocystaceae bacterium]
MGSDKASELLGPEVARLRKRCAVLEAQLKAILEASEGLAWVKDVESRFVHANQAVADIAKLSTDDIPGLTDFDFWQSDQAEAVCRDDVEVMQSQANKFVKEALEQRRGGRSVWLSTRKVPVWLGDEVVGTAGTARDITEEHWASVERDAARNELVENQRRRLDELSTPVLRLWKGVLAVPLIGNVDSERAARLMDVLLTAIQHEGAAEVVLDITGVTEVDGEVAQRLLKAVRAARLVGARCSLVGVRPDVARAIVELDIDIGDVPIFSTLEQALGEVIRRPDSS